MNSFPKRRTMKEEERRVKHILIIGTLSCMLIAISVGIVCILCIDGKVVESEHAIPIIIGIAGVWEAWDSFFYPGST